jgi:hypothetical protein
MWDTDQFLYRPWCFWSSGGYSHNLGKTVFARMGNDRHWPFSRIFLGIWFNNTVPPKDTRKRETRGFRLTLDCLLFVLLRLRRKHITSGTACAKLRPRAKRRPQFGVGLVHFLAVPLLCPKPFFCSVHPS